MSNALTKTFDKKAENNQLKKVIPWVDIYENDDEILVHADMPGVKKEDVTVNVDNGTLAISGIRRMPDKGKAAWREFTDLEYVRKYAVPQSIEIERVEAQLKDGVLLIRLPKSETAKPRTVTIKAA
ncbi:MAG TPA: heat-shock protein [Desulfobacteraceae bacterium]|nr:heat-shock protein [Desulfobacteraceae bacterium]